MHDKIENMYALKEKAHGHKLGAFINTVLKKIK